MTYKDGREVLTIQRFAEAAFRAVGSPYTRFDHFPSDEVDLSGKARDWLLERGWVNRGNIDMANASGHIQLISEDCTLIFTLATHHFDGHRHDQGWNGCVALLRPWPKNWSDTDKLKWFSGLRPQQILKPLICALPVEILWSFNMWPCHTSLVLLDERLDYNDPNEVEGAKGLKTFIELIGSNHFNVNRSSGGLGGGMRDPQDQTAWLFEKLGIENPHNVVA